MHSNVNSNNNNSSSNCPPWFNNAATVQQQQQQQQPQQHQQLQHQQQQRISSWIEESNKNQQQQLLRINNNNNNNNSIMCNNNQNMLQQQQQQQQQYTQQQQLYNYQQQQQQNIATTLPAMNCYYVQQQRQQQNQQQYLLMQQQLRQQQQQQQQLQHQLEQQQQLMSPQQHQLVSVDGIQSGVPTLTTSTLTPTTLRSIEETFIQLTSEPINPPFQAGFIPPPLAPFSPVTNTVAIGTPTTNYGSITDYNNGLDSESEDSQGSWNAANINEDNSLATTDTSSGATDSTSFQNGLNGMGNNSHPTSASSTNDFTTVNIHAIAAAAGKINSISTPNNKNTSNSATPRRNQGGRRPNKSANMTPEEEEKRRIRRERNKLAAARCRKRRVDQTNELLEEVAILEKKREVLQKDIEGLNTTKQELEYLLDVHRPTCQKVREDMLSVSTYGGLIGPASSTSATITGLDPTLSTTGRSHSPIDLKPVLLPGNMLGDVQVKSEPLDTTIDSDSSLDGHDHDGPPSPKRMLLTRNNPMIPPPLPNVATLSASLAAASASLNTPISTTAPVSFSSFGSFNNNCATLQTLNALNKPSNGKQRPNTLPTVPRNLAQSLGLNVDNKPPTDINGVAIQTPSTGMFNFDSLMDGGTGLTPVSGPLMPTCSSQNKHPLELTTPTSEPSKLVSL